MATPRAEVSPGRDPFSWHTFTESGLVHAFPLVLALLTLVVLAFAHLRQPA